MSPAARRTRGRRGRDRIKPWARRLRTARPGLVDDVLESLQSRYGVPEWRRVLVEIDFRVALVRRNDQVVAVGQFEQVPPFRNRHDMTRRVAGAADVYQLGALPDLLA